MLRKLSSIAFVIVFLCIVANAQAQEGENLVQNNDFEDRIHNPWTMWVEDAGVGVAANLVIDKKEKIKGKQSLVIEIKKGGPNNKRIELHQNPFVLKKGTDMTYAFWAKAEDVRLAKMIVNHRQAPWTAYANQEITIQQEWQEFWVEGTITADDNIVGIYVELRDNMKGNVWFDNFRFYEGDYEPDPDVGIDLAVDARGKLSTTWARLKSRD